MASNAVLIRERRSLNVPNSTRTWDRSSYGIMSVSRFDSIKSMKSLMWSGDRENV